MKFRRAIALLWLGAAFVTGNSAFGAVSAASVAGTYSFVSQESGFVVGDRHSHISGSTGTISFDGTGACTFSYSGTGYEAASDGQGGTAVVGSALSKTATTCTYTVSPTGTLDVSADTDSFSFALSPDSIFFTTASAQGSEVGGAAGLSTKQMVAVKRGSNLGNSSLTGTYNFVDQQLGFRQTVPGAQPSDVTREVSGSLTFDGNGGCSLSTEGEEFFHNNSFTPNMLSSGPDTCSYSVSSTGLITLTTPSGTSNLFLSPDGGTLVGGGAEAKNQESLSSKLVAVKAPSDLTVADVEGKYNFSYQEAVFYDPRTPDGSGTSTLDKGISGGNGQMEFDGDGSCFFTYNGQGLGNSLYSDLPGNDPIVCNYSVAPDGRVDVELMGTSFTFWLEDTAAKATGGAALGYSTTVGNVYRVRQILLVQPTFIAAAPESITVPAADADGSYQVTWSASATDGVVYVVQEATDSHFAHNVLEYRSATPSLSITGKSTGSYYYYRVKAVLDGYTDSDWTSSATGCAVPGTPVPTIGTVTVPAQSNNGNYTVTWSASAVNGVTYVLQEATDATFSNGVREAYQGTATSAAITGRLLGSTYYYRVKASAVAYEDSAWQTSGTGCKIALYPAAVPQGITVPATAPGGNYQVSWSASTTPGATYVLQEATDASFATGLREAYSGTATTAAITGGIPGTTYYYRVKAGAAGYEDSAWQTSGTGVNVVDLTPAAAPLTITVPAADPDGSYTVTWGASATKGSTYLLQEASDAAFTQIVQEYQVATLSKLVSGKQLGNQYYYRVKAVHAGNADSAWKTAAAPCAVPGTVLPTLGTLTVPIVDADGSYTVSWNASLSSGVTYVLQQATNVTFTAGVTEAYRGSETSASISGGVTGTTYFYRVKPVKTGYKDAAWKPQAVGCKVIGLGVPAAAPLTLTVPAGSTGSYAVSWGASATKGVTYVLQEATDAAFTQNLQEFAVSGLKQTFAKPLGTTYFYRVKAVHPEYANSPWKTAAAGCAVPGTALATLTTLTVPTVDADGSYTVTWSPSVTADVTYVLQQATNATFTTGLTEAYRGSATSAAISAGVTGTTYFYRVKAVKSGYKDAAWKTQTVGCKVIGLGVPAAAPLTITVPAADADGAYPVSWGASATKGVTYLLQEATDAAFTQNVQEYAVSGILKAITGKSQDTTYYYRVKAVHPEYTDSAWKTAAAGCAVPGTVLAAPTTLTASATQGDGSYQLSWSTSPKAGVTYVLQEATNSTFTIGVTEAYRGEGVTATITGRTPGVSYYYRVKVVKAGNKDSTWKVMTGFKKLAL